MKKKIYLLLMLLIGLVTIGISQTDSAAKNKNGCLSGNCENGYGVKVWNNGARYEGNFKSGLMEGKGKCYFGTGDSWDGDWKADKMNGKGTYVYHDFSKYVGEMKDGMRSGYGVSYNIDGTVYFDGQWLNNEKVAKKSGK